MNRGSIQKENKNDIQFVSAFLRITEKSCLNKEQKPWKFLLILEHAHPLFTDEKYATGVNICNPSSVPQYEGSFLPVVSDEI
jgi:hypothetical protein